MPVFVNDPKRAARKLSDVDHIFLASDLLNDNPTYYVTYEIGINLFKFVMPPLTTSPDENAVTTYIYEI